ncbi:hypothetical protein [Sphingopyxis terrae]|uniref:hypothetical protein n=1 Tax=Sphingopyxis terrae TaxID=33052 RepID=UPI000B1FA574|nr:hypothetical protein [Sphingopyxis terrae]
MTAHFTTSAIKRAIRAAREAGMVVTRIEIAPDGSIALEQAPQQERKKDWRDESWIYQNDKA